MTRSAHQKGFSLIEVVMAIAAVGFLLLLIANIPTSIKLVDESRHQSIAREILSKQIEDKRALVYSSLVEGSQAISDTRLSSLPEGSGTVSIEACPVSICTNNEEAKQVTVTVFWKEGEIAKSIDLKTIISEGGLNQ